MGNKNTNPQNISVTKTENKEENYDKIVFKKQPEFSIGKFMNNHSLFILLGEEKPVIDKVTIIPGGKIFFRVKTEPIMAKHFPEVQIVINCRVPIFVESPGVLQLKPHVKRGWGEKEEKDEPYFWTPFEGKKISAVVILPRSKK